MAALTAINQVNAALGDTFEGRPIIRVIDAATGQYVYGSGVVSTSGDVVLIDTEGRNNTFYAFSTGENWAEVKARYSRLIITGNVSQSGVNNIRPYSAIIDLDSQLAPYESGSGGAQLQLDKGFNSVNVWVNTPQDFNTGFTYRQSGGDTPTGGRMNFKVVGVPK